MGAFVVGVVLIAFGVCLVLVMLQVSPLAALLGLAIYGAVLLARWCRRV
jgi:hypothetical protein